MTFEELVKKHAEHSGLPQHKARTSLRATFNEIRIDVLTNRSSVRVPALSTFVAAPVRSIGRKPDGTTWQKPGRRKLALRASEKSIVE